MSTDMSAATSIAKRDPAVPPLALRHLCAPAKNLQTQIGEFLVKTGVITPQQLDVSLRQQSSIRAGGKQVLLGELIVRNKFASHEQIRFAVKRLDGEIRPCFANCCHPRCAASTASSRSRSPAAC